MSNPAGSKSESLRALLFRVVSLKTLTFLFPEAIGWELHTMACIYLLSYFS